MFLFAFLKCILGKCIKSLCGRFSGLPATCISVLSKASNKADLTSPPSPSGAPAVSGAPALSGALALSGAPALRVKFTEQQAHIFNALFLCVPWAATRRPGPSELYPLLVFARAVPTVIEFSPESYQFICPTKVFEHE